MKPRSPTLRAASSRPPLLALASAISFAAPQLPGQETASPAPEPSVILPPAPQPGAALSAEQRAFFRELALLNARQLSLADEASGRASRSSTRDFADWVRREHRAFAEDLETLAKLLGDASAARAEVPPITERPAWASRDDNDYDEGYVRATAELAERIAERLETVRQSAETSVAAFAQKHLPGIQSRIERAENLRDQL